MISQENKKYSKDSLPGCTLQYAKFRPEELSEYLQDLPDGILKITSSAEFMKTIAEASKSKRLEELQAELGPTACICIGGLVRSRRLARFLTQLGFSILTPRGFALIDIAKVLKAKVENIVTFDRKPVKTVLVLLNPDLEWELIALGSLLKTLIELKKQGKDSTSLRVVVIATAEDALTALED